MRRASLTVGQGLAEGIESPITGVVLGTNSQRAAALQSDFREAPQVVISRYADRALPVHAVCKSRALGFPSNRSVGDERSIGPHVVI